MKRFKSILVSVDALQDEHPALRWAEALAEHNQAALKIVDVVPEVAWPWRLATHDYEHVQELLVKEKAETLAGLAEPLLAKGLRVSTKVLQGRTSAEIIREVLRDHHDLVVRMPKGRLSRRTGYFGSSTIRLLRECPCAVWVVKDGQPRFRRVLATVDPAPRDDEHAGLNRSIMELTLSICQREQGEPLVVHVWNIYGESIFKSRMREDEFHELEEAARKSVEDSFGEFLQPYGVAWPSDQALLLKGDPGVVIPQVVQQFDVDLVVMGTVGRRGVPGLVMGNTAEMILQQIQCGVLAVKLDDFVPPHPPAA